jgi:hypothetical protein
MNSVMHVYHTTETVSFVALSVVAICVDLFI